MFMNLKVSGTSFQNLVKWPSAKLWKRDLTLRAVAKTSTGLDALCVAQIVWRRTR